MKKCDNKIDKSNFCDIIIPIYEVTKMGLAARLSRFSEEYWDFKDFQTSNIHKIAHYPAIMVAPMQKQLLFSLKSEYPQYKNMLDPFHGSGVTMVEGNLIGLHVSGIDINPYAHLITKVKLDGVDKQCISISNSLISQRISQYKVDQTHKRHNFYNIQKWFRDDIINELSIIRQSILEENNKQTRLYYWLCLGEIVKKYSNTRTSTFKLHAKPQDKIEALCNNIISDFIYKITTNYEYLLCNVDANLICGNSILHMKNIASNSVDIICTSPPYGDNNTTVTYGQYSTLQLLWIDFNDLNCDELCICNYSKLDSLSLGGTTSNKVEYTYPSFDEFLEKITETKKKKTRRFVADYEKALIQMHRILSPGGSLVLTLANRRVDNVEFPLIDITKELAEQLDLSLSCILHRKILNKRMPHKVSHIRNQGAVNSMSKETVLIFHKPTV